MKIETETDDIVAFIMVLTVCAVVVVITLAVWRYNVNNDNLNHGLVPQGWARTNQVQLEGK